MSEKELDAAQAELQKLLDERQSLSAQLALASDAEVINVKALVELQKRADEIPYHVFAATVRAKRARIAVLEKKLVSEEAAAQHEIAVASEAYGRLQEAQRAYTAAITLRDNTRTQVAFTRSDLSVAKRELEREIWENSKPHAPIVRSRIHAA
jgi:serine phosphatase RsbU (regulator of sigma subunit)